MTDLVPENEAARITKLRSLAVLDAGADPVLDTLVEVACIALKMPIGLITLVDNDRQWLKARCGIADTGSPREDAFCRYTIAGDTPFVVSDAIQDRRFSKHPLVCGEEHIRFYAGVPIEVEPGIRLGSFCVMDHKPRKLDREAERILKGLAQCAAQRLLQYQSMRLLKQLSPERRNRASTSLALIDAAERALSANAFLLFYQPKFELRTGMRVGFEALLRWRHADGSILTPGAFAEILEEPNVSRQIATFVLREAVSQAKLWEHQGIDFGHIAINASSCQFAETAEGQNFVDEVFAVIENAELNPAKLQIEVTEGVILSGSASGVGHQLARLRAAGFKVAFDDFGTGFASLVHLKDLQYDQIKIDGSFVRAMTGSLTDMAIVKAITELAQSLRKELVAEGIETEAQYEALLKLGCEYGQGYLFGRPVPPSDVT